MNDRQSPTRERDALLSETFHDAWTNGRPAEFARAAARVTRRRRALRRVGAASAIAAVLVAAVLLSRPAPRSSPSTVNSPRAVAAVARGYEIISDDELLAQVRDRSLLAVRRADGTREFVVLANE